MMKGTGNDPIITNDYLPLLYIFIHRLSRRNRAHKQATRKNRKETQKKTYLKSD